MLQASSLFPKSQHIKRLVIFLHGYGSNGQNMMDLAHFFESRLDDTLFLAPNGPKKSPHGIPNAYEWFDLTTHDERHIRNGLKVSVDILIQYIKQASKTHDVPLSSIALVGFSQGTMLALDTLYSQTSVGVIVGYSGTLIPPPWAAKASQTAVQLIHGTKDDVIAHTASIEAKNLLLPFNIHVETYLCENLGHTISVEGIEKGLSFLMKHLKKN